MYAVLKPLTFNSFPVASSTVRRIVVSDCIHTFQFFPSCLLAAPRPDDSAWLAFNSFPVASEGAPPAREGGNMAPFNSFPVASSARPPTLEGAAAPASFQFFPSCLGSVGLIMKSHAVWFFQFFPSCLEEIVLRPMVLFEELTFNSFPVAS